MCESVGVRVELVRWAYLITALFSDYRAKPVANIDVTCNPARISDVLVQNSDGGNRGSAPVWSRLAMFLTLAGVFTPIMTISAFPALKQGHPRFSCDSPCADRCVMACTPSPNDYFQVYIRRKTMLQDTSIVQTIKAKKEVRALGAMERFVLVHGSENIRATSR